MDITALTTIAADQFGLVTKHQAAEHGIDRHGWYRLHERSVLHRIHPGVSALAGSPATPERKVLAAVLATGPRSMASARAAAWLWDAFDPPPETPVDVALRGRPSARGLAGVAAHRPIDHLELVAVRRKGIPVTPPARTVLDLGAVAPWAVRSAVERMVIAGHITREHLERAVERHSRRGRAGIGPLRAVLAEWTLGDRPPESVLEARLLRLVAAAGLPRPEVQVAVGPYLLDIGWPAYRVGGEVDGWGKYSRLDQFDRQIERDAYLQRVGWLVPHFTWRMVTRRPAYVAQTLRDLLVARGWDSRSDS